MDDLAFETKAREIGFQLVVHGMIVVGTLVGLLLVGLFAYMVGEDNRVVGGIIGSFCGAGLVLWWRFIYPLGRTPGPVRCPICGGSAHVEGNCGGGADLVCSQCGRRADTTIHND